MRRLVLFVTSGAKRYVELINEDPSMYGYLVTPRCYCRLKSTRGLFGVDNDRFNGAFSEEAFFSTLRYAGKYSRRAKFVVAPDVPFDAEATLMEFEEWREIIQGFGLPVALALQDGMLEETIDWGNLDAVFVGGTTEWKLSADARRLIRKAQGLGKWVHIGRVNSLRRLSYCRQLGVDSFDGSSFGMFSRNTLKMFKPFMRQQYLDLKVWI